MQAPRKAFNIMFYIGRAPNASISGTLCAGNKGARDASLRMQEKTSSSLSAANGHAALHALLAERARAAIVRRCSGGARGIITIYRDHRGHHNPCTSPGRLHILYGHSRLVCHRNHEADAQLFVSDTLIKSHKNECSPQFPQLH